MAATTLIVAAVALSGAPAYAVNPPGIDPAAVPPDSPPGPSATMKQSSYCTEVGVLPGSDFRVQPKYMDMLNLPEAWRFGRGAGVRVAVIDTGVTPHPRLPHLVPGGDYVMGGGDGLSDCDAHGTIVASMIGGAPARRRGPRGAGTAATAAGSDQGTTAAGAASADDQRGAAASPDDHAGAGPASIGRAGKFAGRQIRRANSPAPTPPPFGAPPASQSQPSPRHRAPPTMVAARWCCPAIPMGDTWFRSTIRDRLRRRRRWILRRQVRPTRSPGWPPTPS